MELVHPALKVELEAAADLLGQSIKQKLVLLFRVL